MDRDYEMKPRQPIRTNSLFGYDPQVQLLNALHQRNIRTFRNLLESNDVDPNHCYNAPDYKTCLDIACSEPHLSKYVKLLLDNNAKINVINETHVRAPLHFAVETGDIETIKILLQQPEIEINILSKGNTALHLAIKQIEDTDEDREDFIQKYEEIVEMLLKAGTDVNIPDTKKCTAIYSAAKQGLESIVKLILEFSTEPIDLDSYEDRRKKTARMLIEQAFPHLLKKLQQKTEKERPVDIHKLFSFITSHDEENFLQSIEKIKSENLKNILTENNGLHTLLQFACANGLDRIVSKLLEKGADPNLVAPGNSNKPIALACLGGYHKVLKLLIHNNLTSLEPINGDSLLHISIKEENNILSSDNVDYKECVKLLLETTKNQPDINFRDIKDNTALHYATKAGNQELVLELLRRGAYVGVWNKFNDPPLADISASTLETFLDECITTNSERPNDDDYEIIYNYKFLVPPNNKTDKDTCKVPLMGDLNNSSETSDSVLAPETDVLLYMSKRSELKHLLIHPVISSFLHLKWQRISSLFWANMTFYCIFWLALVSYIMLGYEEIDEKGNITTALYVTKYATIIGLTILSVREIFQLIVSPRRYIKSIENWLEMFLILTIFLILLIDEPSGNKQQLCAVAILLSSAELVLLIGSLPSLSTNIVMLKTVSWNFFKFLFWYCILIIAFALSFYTLFRTNKKKEDADSETVPFNPNTSKSPDNDEEEETDFFLDPGMSLFKTIVMLTGELDAGSIHFHNFPITSHIIFIIFVFMIPIVLFNLLNGLAVSDTQAIKAEAELVAHISTVKLISYFENIFLGDTSVYKSAVSKMQNNCCWLPGHMCIKPRFFCIRPIAQKICLFPDYLPAAKIGVKINQSLTVEVFTDDKKQQRENEDNQLQICCFTKCYNITMDRKIIKAAKNVIIKKKDDEIDLKKIGLRLCSLEKKIEQLCMMHTK